VRVRDGRGPAPGRQPRRGPRPTPLTPCRLWWRRTAVWAGTTFGGWIPPSWPKPVCTHRRPRRFVFRGPAGAPFDLDDKTFGNLIVPRSFGWCSGPLAGGSSPVEFCTAPDAEAGPASLPARGGGLHRRLSAGQPTASSASSAGWGGKRRELIPCVEVRGGSWRRCRFRTLAPVVPQADLAHPPPLGHGLGDTRCGLRARFRTCPSAVGRAGRTSWRSVAVGHTAAAAGVVTTKPSLPVGGGIPGLDRGRYDAGSGGLSPMLLPRSGSDGKKKHAGGPRTTCDRASFIQTLAQRRRGCGCGPARAGPTRWPSDLHAAGPAGVDRGSYGPEREEERAVPPGSGAGALVLSGRRGRFAVIPRALVGGIGLMAAVRSPAALGRSAATCGVGRASARRDMRRASPLGQPWRGARRLRARFRRHLAGLVGGGATRCALFVDDRVSVAPATMAGGDHRCLWPVDRERWCSFVAVVRSSRHRCGCTARWRGMAGARRHDASRPGVAPADEPGIWPANYQRFLAPAAHGHPRVRVRVSDSRQGQRLCLVVGWLASDMGVPMLGLGHGLPWSARRASGRVAGRCRPQSRVAASSAGSRGTTRPHSSRSP
jgi:hypothetical protein